MAPAIAAPDGSRTDPRTNPELPLLDWAKLGRQQESRLTPKKARILFIDSVSGHFPAETQANIRQRLRGGSKERAGSSHERASTPYQFSSRRTVWACRLLTTICKALLRVIIQRWLLSTLILRMWFTLTRLFRWTR